MEKEKVERLSEEIDSYKKFLTEFLGISSENKDFFRKFISRKKGEKAFEVRHFQK